MGHLPGLHMLWRLGITDASVISGSELKLHMLSREAANFEIVCNCLNLVISILRQTNYR